MLLARKHNCDISISTSYQVAKYKSGRTWLISSSIECPAYDPWWEVRRAFESGILYDPAFSTGCGMIFVSSISIILSWLLLEGSGLNALKGTLNQNYLRPSRFGGRTVSKSQRYQGSSITKCRRHCLIMLVFNAHPGFDVQLLRFSKKHVSGTATSQQKGWLDHLNLSTYIHSAKLSDSCSGINELNRTAFSFQTWRPIGVETADTSIDLRALQSHQSHHIRKHKTMSVPGIPVKRVCEWYDETFQWSLHYAWKCPAVKLIPSLGISSFKDRIHQNRLKRMSNLKSLHLSHVIIPSQLKFNRAY